MDWSGTEALAELMSGGGMMPAQLPTGCFWSAEKRLAGAVLAAALIEVRDHHGDPKYRRAIAEDMVWIGSSDTRDPYAFIRLCQLFNMDPVWVRETVYRWAAAAPFAQRPPATPVVAHLRRRRAATSTKAVMKVVDQRHVGVAD